ncbi:MAG TPA: hypothetical protein VHW23_20860, partial [Kofleriaceae bacterium]|nr:hypothetical protein [Kofleriaceae bacterium]
MQPSDKLRDATRGGVNGAASPGQPPAGGKISPLSIDQPGRGAAPDTSAIAQLIARARRRIRGQRALDGATTATILAAAAALAVVFLIRVEVVGPIAGMALLAGAAGIIVLGAVVAAMRRIDDEHIARRIDRASNLADRLSTAVAFSRAGVASEDEETHQLMIAAIRDGVRAVPRANVQRATPFAAPADLRAALGFLAISALAAGLAIPTVDRAPHLYRAEPDHGAAGDQVVLIGANLMTGIAHPLASLPAPGAFAASLGVPSAPAEAMAPAPQTSAMIQGFIPADAQVMLGAGRAHPVRVLNWAADQILIEIPADAPLGPTTLTAWIDDRPVGPLVFTVIDKKDPRYHKPDSVALDPDDRAYLDTLLNEIKAIAKRDQVPELEDFAKQVEQLLKDAELGKISKEKLLEALAKAETQLEQHTEPDQADVDKQLAELGKQLSKDQMTKSLGDALQKTDLDKAKQELEKLAEKLDKKELSEQQQEELAKQLDKASKQLDDKQQQQDKQHQQNQQKLENDIRQLEKKKQDAKTEQERLDAERQLNKRKEELKKLEKDSEDKEQSEQRQALKRLSRDLEKAAQDMQKKDQQQQDQKDQKDQKDQQQDQQQQGQQQQASQKLKDAARETGRVDQERRKMATQKKMSSQMQDLREAMQRAKQKGGGQDGKDPFGRQNKNRDFAQRARGQRGQSSAWKPGQGQQPGQGQPGQGQGGQGQPQDSKEWGVGHDDNLVGDPTQKSGDTKDADLQGAQGRQGGGTRETILAAAQKGFASERYRDVYGKYHQIVEEVMRTEKLPSSYKYYVKR